MMIKYVEITDENDSQFGNYVSYYGCSWSKCWFTPRLYKDKLEAIFAKKQIEAQAQNQILSSLSDWNTTSDVNTDVLNSSNTSDSGTTDSTLIDSSEDEISSKLE